jgi:hypothetical protein
MSFSEPFGPSATETSEIGVEGNIRELARAGAVFRQGESCENETSMTGLDRLLNRVSGHSRRQIDTLIGELETLREKLETDSQRLQIDISEYASLSQQVMQVANIISESVRQFPHARKPSAEAESGEPAGRPHKPPSS